MTRAEQPGEGSHGGLPTIGGREADRIPLVRPLDAVAALADAVGARRAAAVDRAGGRGRGARRGRRLLPRPSLRPAARRRPSRCWRRSARAPAASRSARRSSTCATRTRSTWPRTRAPPTSSPAAGCSSGISRGSPEQVIDGWRYFGYVPAEGETDADMARRHAEVFLELARGRGVRRAQPAADVPQSAGPAAPRAALPGPARPHLVGRRLERHRGVGGEAGHEPPELDPEVRRERRAVPRPAGGADRRLPRGVARGRARARAARLGEPQHLRAGRRSRPRLLRPRRQGSDQIGYIDETTRAIFGRTYAAEPDVLVERLARTRPSRRPTRCC